MDRSEYVAAKGTTEFGAFISAGRLDPCNKSSSSGGDDDDGSGGGVWLTLARRYLDDADPRKKWTAQRVWEQLQQEATPASTSKPWRSPSMRLRLS